MDKAASPSTVSSYNEWDPLEEVIVGVAEGAVIPPWHIALKAIAPKKYWHLFRKSGGKPFPQETISAASAELETFCQLLSAEGVTVRRPLAIDQQHPYSTMDWATPSGLYQAMPRDLLLVIGDEIIEAPLAWRSRYLEVNAYRPLLKEYFKRGARWCAAPRPELKDSFYHIEYSKTAPDELCPYVIGEEEPTFDAADFTRCGKDIFVQKSNVTNSFGIAWLQRHLGEKYRIHILKFNDSHPMHIDATFVPLAPGHLLVNPERVHNIDPMFKSWNIIQAPPSCIPADHPLYMSSSWLSMNIFSLDERRIFVEAGELPLQETLKKNGFQPIPCPFRHFNSLGGSFHCATLDMRRKGKLESYF